MKYGSVKLCLFLIEKSHRARVYLYNDNNNMMLLNDLLCDCIYYVRVVYRYLCCVYILL